MICLRATLLTALLVIPCSVQAGLFPCKSGSTCDECVTSCGCADECDAEGCGHLSLWSRLARHWESKKTDDGCDECVEPSCAAPCIEAGCACPCDCGPMTAAELKSYAPPAMPVTESAISKSEQRRAYYPTAIPEEDSIIPEWENDPSLPTRIAEFE